MGRAAVTVAAYLAENDAPFGPATIEHRTARTGLERLGSYFMVFHSEEPSDPWTLHYEETIFVIEGQARLIVVEDGVERRVDGDPGDLIVVTRGASIRYAASRGTRLLLSISPVNWRTDLD